MVRRTSFIFLLLGSTLALGQADGPPRARTLVFDPKTGEWVEVPPPPPGTEEGDLHDLKLLVKEQRFRASLRDSGKFVKRYGKESGFYPDILIIQAESWMGLRDFYKAHLILQGFLNEFAGIAATADALRLEFVIAETFLTGVKRKWWGIPLLSGDDIAYRIYDDISTEHSGDRIAELAVKAKADDLFQKGEYALAELDYARLLKDYPQSRYHQYALRRSAESALASYGGTDYDEAALIESEARFRDYRQRYPAAADREGTGLILDTIRESRAEKDFAIASYYERTNHLVSSIFYYRIVAREWPGTLAYTKARTRLELLGDLEPVASAGASLLVTLR